MHMANNQSNTTGTTQLSVTVIATYVKITAKAMNLKVAKKLGYIRQNGIIITMSI